MEKWTENKHFKIPHLLELRHEFSSLLHKIFPCSFLVAWNCCYSTSYALATVAGNSSGADTQGVQTNYFLKTLFEVLHLYPFLVLLYSKNYLQYSQCWILRKIIKMQSWDYLINYHLVDIRDPHYSIISLFPPPTQTIYLSKCSSAFLEQRYLR